MGFELIPYKHQSTTSPTRLPLTTPSFWNGIYIHVFYDFRIMRTMLLIVVILVVTQVTYSTSYWMFPFLSTKYVVEIVSLLSWSTILCLDRTFDNHAFCNCVWKEKLTVCSIKTNSCVVCLLIVFTQMSSLSMYRFRMELFVWQNRLVVVCMFNPSIPRKKY